MARQHEKTDTATDADLGQAEVQRKVNEAAEKGYIGVSPDPNPNEAYSLESGPDSPRVDARTPLKSYDELVADEAGKA